MLFLDKFIMPRSFKAYSSPPLNNPREGRRHPPPLRSERALRLTDSPAIRGGFGRQSRGSRPANSAPRNRGINQLIRSAERKLADLTKRLNARRDLEAEAYEVRLRLNRLRGIRYDVQLEQGEAAARPSSDPSREQLTILHSTRRLPLAGVPRGNFMEVANNNRPANSALFSHAAPLAQGSTEGTEEKYEHKSYHLRKTKKPQPLTPAEIRHISRGAEGLNARPAAVIRTGSPGLPPTRDELRQLQIPRIGRKGTSFQGPPLTGGPVARPRTSHGSAKAPEDTTIPRTEDGVRPRTQQRGRGGTKASTTAVIERVSSTTNSSSSSSSGSSSTTSTDSSSDNTSLSPSEDEGSAGNSIKIVSGQMEELTPPSTSTGATEPIQMVSASPNKEKEKETAGAADALLLLSGTSPFTMLGSDELNEAEKQAAFDECLSRYDRSCPLRDLLDLEEDIQEAGSTWM